MSTLGEQIKYDGAWNPESINLKAVEDILNEVRVHHDVQDPSIADSLAKRLLITADHLSDDVTKVKIYYTRTRSKAKDRMNDVKQSAIDEKSDAGKERVALCDPTFRELRDEYKKAELLMTHLEIKYKELISFHYVFKDTAKRLAGLSYAGSQSSDTEKREDFTPQLPIKGKPEDEEPF